MNEAPAITPAPVGERPSPALPGHKGSEQMTTDVAADGSAPIQQSPTERAREVLARHIHGSDREAVTTGWGSDYGRIKPSEAIAAMIEFASQAAQPAEADEAAHVREQELQEIADGAYGDGPMMRGAARDLPAATPKAPATNAGEVVERTAVIAVVDDLLISLREALEQEGVSAATLMSMAPSIQGLEWVKEKVAALATPPAPNDDLRAALEAALGAPSWPASLDYVRAALKENHRG